MRNTFISKLCDLAKDHDDVFLLSGDLGYSVLEPFKEQFPERFLNVGIAEQNMTQVAVGLAMEGFNVFTYSIGNFPTLRCMEQIRYDVCYHKANVKIVAVGAGYAYGSQGVSHHTTEDIAMMRSIPGMMICSPADTAEAEASASFMVNHTGPGYVRLNKSGEVCLHNLSHKLNFTFGKFIELLHGAETLVLATGAITSTVLDEVKKNSLGWAVWSSPFIGSYDEGSMIDIANCFKNVVTVEEHQLNGGFGSSLVEQFSDLFAVGKIKRMPRVQRVGIPNIFLGKSGTQENLRATAGITICGITLVDGK